MTFPRGKSEINRRSLITGLISFVAAPAIVRAGSLMPVKVMPSYYPGAVLDIWMDWAMRNANPPWPRVLEANAIIDDLPFIEAHRNILLSDYWGYMT